MGYEDEISKQVQTNKLPKNEYGIPQFFLGKENNYIISFFETHRCRGISEKDLRWV
jgi:hypothetical protein